MAMARKYASSLCCYLPCFHVFHYQNVSFNAVLSLSVRLDKATNENNTSEQWDVILEICDKVGHSSKNSKESLQAIVRRLNHTDPHVGVQAVTVSC